MTPELSPRFSHPRLEEVIVALVAEPRVVMRIAFGAAADPETSARAAWDRETALDEPAVRFCNILLMMAKDAGATHLRVANGTIAYRVGAAWSAGPQLPREIRAHVLEWVSLRRGIRLPPRSASRWPGSSWLKEMARHQEQLAPYQ